MHIFTTSHTSPKRCYPDVTLRVVRNHGKGGSSTKDPATSPKRCHPELDEGPCYIA